MKISEQRSSMLHGVLLMTLFASGPFECNRLVMCFESLRYYFFQQIIRKRGLSPWCAPRAKQYLHESTHLSVN